MVHSKCVTLLTGCLMLSSLPRDFPSGASGAGCNLIPSLHFRKIPHTCLQVRSVLNDSHVKKPVIVNFYLCLELCCEAFLSFVRRYLLFSFNYTVKVIIDTIALLRKLLSTSWYLIWTTKYFILPTECVHMCIHALCICLNDDNLRMYEHVWW